MKGLPQFMWLRNEAAGRIVCFICGDFQFLSDFGKS